MAKATFINGYKIYPFQDRRSFLQFLENGNWENMLVALNAEKLVKEDEELRTIVNNNIGYPDGVGAVWALKKSDFEAIKIPGAEFWLNIIEAFHMEKSFYFVGGKPNVLLKTVNKLNKEFPDIEIKGFQNGYFDDAEYEVLLNDIIKKKPDVVFVAMGSPKQEIIMHDMQTHHKALYMGLGGSFDVYTGHVERAPESWIKLNLEWAYRLFKQPSRIFRQKVLVTFMYRLLTGKL